MSTIIKKSELKEMIKEAIKSHLSEQNMSQDQGPLNRQLQRLVPIAEQNGFFESADFINGILNKQKNHVVD